MTLFLLGLSVAFNLALGGYFLIKGRGEREMEESLSESFTETDEDVVALRARQS